MMDNGWMELYFREIMRLDSFEFYCSKIGKRHGCNRKKKSSSYKQLSSCYKCFAVVHRTQINRCRSSVPGPELSVVTLLLELVGTGSKQMTWTALCSLVCCPQTGSEPQQIRFSESFSMEANRFHCSLNVEQAKPSLTTLESGRGIVLN